MNIDVVIVGGGIAGLSAAFELQKRGRSFVVLERAARTGGVIVSEQVGDFVIDGGPDSLLTQKPEGVALCQELGIAHRLVPTKPPRLAYIQRGGRLYPLPASSVLGIPTRVGPFVQTGLFSWTGKLRMAAELFVPARTDGADESIGSFMRRRFGDEAVTYLAEPLLAGIHAGDVDRLSIRALFPRFVETERTYGSLLRAFRRERRPPSPDGVFRSFPGGLSELVTALTQALPAESIRLAAAVQRVSRDRAWTVETADGSRYSGRALVVTSPAYVTADLVRGVDPDLARLCAEIPYASSGTVALAFPRAAVAHPLNGSGFVVPRVERTGIMAASWLSSKWPNRAPDDRVLMRAFVGGGRDPEALSKSDDELVGVALAALRPLLGITGEPILSRVYRFDRKSAQHEVGHLDRMAAIDRRLAAHPDLYVTGSGFRGVGIPDCVADARATARKVSECLPAS
ncbi:MAG TPA: protoporphyrinogen oxidase [Vicinamibacterales bacterium]|nr:protoporphyrinogen oxidase [Vicinamibacterales bacterium]